MKRFSIITFLILNICMFSCKDKTIIKENDTINPITKKWIGKQIIFPSTVVKLGDSIIKNKRYKHTIIGFYDGHCSMCYFELLKWQNTILKYQKRNGENINFIFIVSGNSKAYVGYTIKELGFPLDLVYYDSKDAFSTKHPFLLESGYKYSSILLNEKNEILAIGNPTISKDDDNRFLNLLQ